MPNKSIVKRCQCLFFMLTVSTTLIVIEGNSHAGTYYVAPAGNASWSNCTNINNPCSPVTAMENAIADDIVYFRGGTYTVAESNDIHGTYEPKNYGTAGHPITFKAYTGETPIMNSIITTPGRVSSRAIGVGRDYIVIDGFTFQANSGARKGGMIVTGQYVGRRVIGNVVKNCIFNGGTEIPAFTDNNEGLRLEDTSYTTVQNNTFFSYKEINNVHNTSAVKAYHNDHLTFSNNEIYNCSVGLYLKSKTDDSTISYNWFHDNWIAELTAIFYTSSAYNADRLIWHNNVFSNNSGNMAIDQDDGVGVHADDWQIYNNTFYGNSSAAGILWMRTTALANGPVIYNNIMYGITGATYYQSQLMGQGSTTGPVGLVEENYNQLGPTNVYIKMRLYTPGATVYNSLSAWQASTELASGGHPGTGDLASNPLFVNGSGKYTRLSDFNLQAGSPCKGTGKGGVDMGANIALVGTGRPPLKVPSPPPNAR